MSAAGARGGGNGKNAQLICNRCELFDPFLVHVPSPLAGNVAVNAGKKSAISWQVEDSALRCPAPRTSGARTPQRPTARSCKSARWYADGDSAARRLYLA